MKNGTEGLSVQIVVGSGLVKSEEPTIVRVAKLFSDGTLDLVLVARDLED